DIDQWGAVITTDKQRGRDWISASLAHEIRYRLRFTPMRDTERCCLINRLHGMSGEESAKMLGITIPAVDAALQRGMNSLKASPMQTASDATMTAEYLFWLGSRVTVYRAPVSLGSALAREHLRLLK